MLSKMAVGFSGQMDYNNLNLNWECVLYTLWDRMNLCFPFVILWCRTFSRRRCCICFALVPAVRNNRLASHAIECFYSIS